VQSRAEPATVITRSDAPPTRCNSPRRRVATLRQDSDDTTSSALCGHDRRPPTADRYSPIFSLPLPSSLPAISSAFSSGDVLSLLDAAAA